MAVVSDGNDENGTQLQFMPNRDSRPGLHPGAALRDIPSEYPAGTLPQSCKLDCGALAQLGEHLLCKQGVIGSIPIRSTKSSI